LSVPATIEVVVVKGTGNGAAFMTGHVGVAVAPSWQVTGGGPLRAVHFLAD
jgi:hypothetical protein